MQTKKIGVGLVYCSFSICFLSLQSHSTTVVTGDLQYATSQDLDEPSDEFMTHATHLVQLQSQNRNKSIITNNGDVSRQSLIDLDNDLAKINFDGWDDNDRRFIERQSTKRINTLLSQLKKRPDDIRIAQLRFVLNYYQVVLKTEKGIGISRSHSHALSELDQLTFSSLEKFIPTVLQQLKQLKSKRLIKTPESSQDLENDVSRMNFDGWTTVDRHQAAFYLIELLRQLPNPDFDFDKALIYVKHEAKNASLKPGDEISFATVIAELERAQKNK